MKSRLILTHHLNVHAYSDSVRHRICGDDGQTMDKTMNTIHTKLWQWLANCWRTCYNCILHLCCVLWQCSCHTDTRTRTFYKHWEECTMNILPARVFRLSFKIDERRTHICWFSDTKEPFFLSRRKTLIRRDEIGNSLGSPVLPADRVIFVFRILFEYCLDRTKRY